MSYEVQGNSSIRLSGENGLKIDLQNAQAGLIQTRWPSFNNAILEQTDFDSEAIIHKDVPYFCLYKSKPVSSRVPRLVAKDFLMTLTDDFFCLAIHRHMLQSSIIG